MTRLTLRRFLPRRSVRLRLTLVYSALFLVSGAVLVGITYGMVDRATSDAPFLRGDHPVARFIHHVPLGIGFGSGTASAQPGSPGQKSGAGATPVLIPGTSANRAIISAPGGTDPGQSVTIYANGGQRFVKAIVNGKAVRIPIPRWLASGNPPTAKQIQDQVRILHEQAVHYHDDEMHQLLLYSGIALGFIALLSVVLGWIIGGKVLRPVHTITSAARDISATNLHERIGLDGPEDELKELGDTFDALLERLEKSFDTQRQFVANASHELRTPLARQRTLIEVALADPDAGADSLRAMSERVLAAGEEQERLIESLLVLATSERGLGTREPLDLASVAQEVVCTRQTEAEMRGLRIDVSLRPAITAGSPHLAHRLIANLLDNALRYNEEGGWIRITTGTRDSQALLSISNTGQVIPDAEIDRLFLPFQRIGAARTGPSDGHGLGLSIVTSIAEAHDAVLIARARPRGGLDIEVGFPLREELPGRRPEAQGALAPASA